MCWRPRIDRLAASSRELLNIVHDIEARGERPSNLFPCRGPTSMRCWPQPVTMLSAFAQLDRASILASTNEV